MKIKYIYIVLSLVVVSFLAIAAVSSAPSAEKKTNKDIIKFSHKKHEGVDCIACHKDVPNSTSLDKGLLPEMAACGDCHDVSDDKNCTMCHYKDQYEPLVNKQPSVYFNHKFHITDQKQEDCLTCHKGISEVNYGFESKGPQMNACYTCHNNKTKAAEYCESCHISTVNLLPDNHKTASFKKNHKILAKDKNANCAMCHDNEFCEACHVATTAISAKNTKSDFFAPYSTYNLIDGVKQQKLDRVHDLNYVYTHGIDLKGKTSECKTCHNDETFCVECHNSKGGDYAMSGFTPTSHKVVNFVTIGVGTGGGEHAILARRDIESCASCHDVQGGDPNCILCHVDNTGVKGTHPKTHAKNFMRDVHGDWHTDEGSVCYNCHTDANARPSGIAGVGFCGYCHSRK